MATIQNIRQRAQQLAEKWQKLSISPEEVGLLIDDLAALVNDAVINGSSLGIRRTYDSLSAMNSDGTTPNDQWGEPLKRGQLVAIASTDADAGKIYLFADPNWAYVTTVDARYVTVDALEEVNNKLTELGEKIPNTNFITCSTLNSVANKTVNILNFKLSNRVRLLVKMVNANAADNANLSISSPQLDTKPLYYNGERASATNTWEAGAVLDVYYDGTNFQAADFQGGASGAGGNKILEWNTDVATTRKQVKQADRKEGMQISYLHPDNGWVNEQFVGVSFTDVNWVKDENWSTISNLADITVTEFDSSISANSFNLTFEDAINRVPKRLRKFGLICKYNNSFEIQFLSSDIAKWGNKRYWLNRIKASFYDAGIPEACIYRGFTFVNSSTIEEHPDNACIIIPIKPTDNPTVDKINFNCQGALDSIPVKSCGFLDSSMRGLSNSPSMIGINAIQPSNAAFLFCSIALHRDGVSYGLKNIDRFKTLGYYRPISSLKDRFVKMGVSGIPKEPFLVNTLSEDYSIVRSALNKSFKVTKLLDLGFNINDIVEARLVRADQIYNEQSGMFRKVYIGLLSFSSMGSTIRLYIEDKKEKDKYYYSTPASITIYPEGSSIANGDYIVGVTPLTSGMNFEIKVYIKDLIASNGVNISLGTLDTDNALISDDVYEDFINRKIDRVAVFPQFTFFERVNFSSNYTYKLPEAGGIAKAIETYGESYKLQGEMSKNKRIGLVSGPNLLVGYGNKTVKIPVKSDSKLQDNYVCINTTSFSNGVSDKIKAAGQWVHPDMCYCDTPVAGYKYWMVASIYPFTNPNYEDAEVFVSNDGLNWTRIKSIIEPHEEEELTIPETFFASVPEDKRGYFMPIPHGGESIEFATESETLNTEVASYLNHDPMIAYHDGGVNIYITYNLRLVSDTVGSKKLHKYRVCYRTENGKDWFIVQEDGTKLPYNEENGIKVFSKTNGKRNHIQYLYDETGVEGKEVCPSLVKVSDSEYYIYSRNEEGNTMNVMRRKSTTPYSFTDGAKDVCDIDSTYDYLWHPSFRYIGNKYYCIYQGVLATSDDGINWTTMNNPFICRILGDMYKATFTVGENGKIKVVYGLQLQLLYPFGFDIKKDFGQKWTPVTKLIATEFTSISEVENLSSTEHKDGWVEGHFYSISKKNGLCEFTLIPPLRKNAELTVNTQLDGDIVLKLYPSTYNDGAVEVGCVTVE